MSYQVLARKWRPSDFSELVGQQQTAQALINALESQRLHHAYLFTGTRGVGKTTIARILSKSLNCEKGITSNPCGECSSCVEISQGNFVDLLEIDAASKTKVEDTRELLDNVQYRPTRGRYKVYLIDEVHMLSGHSFNALLKTLEEPPPHVIFLLATTDPQKMPVTVLSRCLQFHLRRMEIDEITDHLTHILKAENIECEEGALNPIAQGADGSMRDALSLLDQAIAYCGTGIQKQTVLDMLGSLDKEYAFQLLQAVVSDDANHLMNVIENIAQFSPNYEDLISDWLSLLHQIAVCQATGNSEELRINELANSIASADIQLFYQLSLHAKRDLGFAPHPRQGFEMAMLRIMAFKPQTQPSPSNDKTSSTEKKTVEKITSEQATEKQSATKENISKVSQLKTEAISANQKINVAEKLNVAEQMSAQVQNKTELVTEPEKNDFQPQVLVKDKPVSSSNVTPIRNDINVTQDIKNNNTAEEISNSADKKISFAQKSDPVTFIELNQVNENNWYQVVAGISLTGQSLQLLLNSLAVGSEQELKINILQSMQPLFNDNAKQTIEKAMRDYFNHATLKITIDFVESSQETPRERASRLHEIAVDKAQQMLENDPQIQKLIEKLEGVIPRESIILK